MNRLQVTNTTGKVNGASWGHGRSVTVKQQQLDFVRVFNAGHLVPHDQPDAALQLLDTVLAGKAFF